jgi:hypothetical protein
MPVRKLGAVRPWHSGFDADMEELQADAAAIVLIFAVAGKAVAYLTLTVLFDVHVDDLFRPTLISAQECIGWSAPPGPDRSGLQD